MFQLLPDRVYLGRQARIGGLFDPFINQVTEGLAQVRRARIARQHEIRQFLAGTIHEEPPNALTALAARFHNTSEYKCRSCINPIVQVTYEY